jgi:hypothetical protein
MVSQRSLLLHQLVQSAIVSIQFSSIHLIGMMSLSNGNISDAHGTLVHMIHILNPIYQSQIQSYLHILGKTPLIMT